jgi:hypothetical protein
MRGYLIEDYVLDIGTLSNYELAQVTWPGNNGVLNWTDPSERQPAGALQPASHKLQVRTSSGEIR